MSRAAEVDGGTMHIAALQRVRGWAWLGEGDFESAATAFIEARDAAESRADDYQVALALEGLIASRLAVNEEIGSLMGELLGIRDRLGIVTRNGLDDGVRRPGIERRRCRSTRVFLLRLRYSLSSGRCRAWSPTARASRSRA